MVNSLFDPDTAAAYLAAHHARTEQTRRENEAALPLAEFMSSLTPHPLLPAGPIRQPSVADLKDFDDDFTPVRLKQSADIQDMADDLKDAEKEVVALQQQIDQYEKQETALHFLLNTAAIQPGNLYSRVQELIDKWQEALESADETTVTDTTEIDELIETARIEANNAAFRNRGKVA